MNIYDVTIERTEVITFRVKADSKAEALENYLMLGDEVASETISIKTTNVEES